MASIQVGQMLPKGTLLHHGSYRIDSYLASGGFGNTYLATNTAFNERVAIKEFFLRGSSERTQDLVSIRVTQGSELHFKEQKEKFKKEAQRIRALHNPHIVRVHDLFEDNGTVYYVMDYIEGESVAARLVRNNTPMEEEEVRNILFQILDALKEVHAAGLRHLDIKPDNILIDANNNVYLIDFGASKMQSSHNAGITHTSAITATPEYAPLELMSGNTQNIGPWTDFYSLGATAVRLLTNQNPPTADTLLEMSMDWFNPKESISESMKEFVLRCMTISTRLRPQTAEEALDILIRTYEKGQNTPSPKPFDYAQPIQNVADTTKILSAQPTQNNNLGSFVYSEPKSKNSSLIYILMGTVAILLIIVLFIIFGGKKENDINNNKETIEDYTNNLEESVDDADNIDTSKNESFDNERSFPDKKTITVNNIPFNMIRVDGGSFQMGSYDGEANENPVHEVTLDTYYIGEAEVTQELWEYVMGGNPSSHIGTDFPVENVSWNDCQDFISELNRLTGYQFRLPTEAEWEYAAKGGIRYEGFNYSGSTNAEEVGWIKSNCGGSTHNVCTKPSNALGIFDMTGNVCEWCQDWFSTYDSYAVTNPTGPSNGSAKVGRGGGWCNSASKNRVTMRFSGVPSYSDHNLGFRLAM